MNYLHLVISTKQELMHFHNTIMYFFQEMGLNAAYVELIVPDVHVRFYDWQVVSCSVTPARQIILLEWNSVV